jgi:Domain of unknown function (DUF4190)/Septum formation
MTVPPPESGAPPPWNRPSAGGAWSADEPPAGLPPQAYPTQTYPAQTYPAQTYPAQTYPPTPGYDPQGYPAQGYPPPYPDPGYPGQPAVQRGTNGFAIAALIFGIIGGAVLGFIFGFIALNQIKKNGQGGRGMAIAGLVLSGLWTLFVVAVVIIAITTSPSRDDSGTITSSGSVSATALRPGDCVNNLNTTTATVLSLPAVPCSQAHEGEVFAVFDLADGPYPGENAITNQATSGCQARIDAYSPTAGTDGTYTLVWIYPRQQDWAKGSREITCVAAALSGTTTGSIKGR